MERFNELDSVITLVEKHGIPKGTKGCIVHIYPDGKACTCELFDAGFHTIGVEDYEFDEIRRNDFENQKQL